MAKPKKHKPVEKHIGSGWPRGRKIGEIPFGHEAVEESGLSDQLRAAISSSGMSISTLSKGIWVSHSVLSRFLRQERTITLETADKLVRRLGLKLVPT